MLSACLKALAHPSIFVLLESSVNRYRVALVLNKFPVVAIMNRLMKMESFPLFLTAAISISLALLLLASQDHRPTSEALESPVTVRSRSQMLYGYDEGPNSLDFGKESGISEGMDLVCSQIDLRVLFSLTCDVDQSRDDISNIRNMITPQMGISAENPWKIKIQKLVKKIKKFQEKEDGDVLLLLYHVV